MTVKTAGTPITTNIPQRLDRLPWSRWHWMIVIALGVTWLLDGLEVTIVGTLGAVLTRQTTLGLSEGEVGLSASAYLLGTVFGALIFSYLTDLSGRKRWFLATLILYLAATVATAFSWNYWSFLVFRFLAGAGIGGEYSAVNSAIDELIPARVRGHTDLAINGSWWLGTMAGACLTIPLLNSALIDERIGWRLCFGLGGVLGLAVLLVRRYVPESPRWLMTRGRIEEAEIIVSQIEKQIVLESTEGRLPEPAGSITIRPGTAATLFDAAQQVFKAYPRRTVLGATLMVAQSFLYNAIFFTFALVLSKYYAVGADSIGWYTLPFALVNFCGPLALGRFFDTIGRKFMLFLTYSTAGALLAVSAYLFLHGNLTALTQTIAWSAVFFFASAGASAAYLTVSEIFPLEVRAMAIAFFFVIGQGAGVLAPWIFAKLIESSVNSLFWGYLAAAGLMAIAAAVSLLFGVQAHRQPLESIAAPLSAD